jgi:hypothetical protein
MALIRRQIAPYECQMRLKGACGPMGATCITWEPYGGILETLLHLTSHVGGVGCDIAVGAIWELYVVMWEVYGIVWKPDAPDWSRMIHLGAMWCCMKENAICESYFPTWEPCVTIQELRAPYGSHTGQTMVSRG